MRLRRRPPAAGAAAGDPNNPDEGGGSCDGDDGFTGIVDVCGSGMVGGEGNTSSFLPNGHQLLDLGCSACLGCSAGCCSSGFLGPNHPNNPPRLLLVLLDLDRDLHLRDFDLDL